MKDLAKLLSESPALFKRQTTEALKFYQGTLERLYDAYSYLGSSFYSVESLRIIAANDSTFTESFNSSYGDENGVVGLYNQAKSAKFLQWGKLWTKGIGSSSHSKLQDLVGGSGLFGSGNSLERIAEGVAFGMNLSAPQMWNSSSYNSNLTVFIKLISPIGTEECIQKNILKPLLYLTAAAAPTTATGLLSGIPPLWTVEAHGVANFRLGAITSMTVIRGSFETTFSDKLQPTILDVRLTITPLLNDFALQGPKNAGGNSPKNIYTKAQREYLGVQNPSDIITGTMNSDIQKNTEIVTINI
jgi:hypothetical protein